MSTITIRTQFVTAALSLLTLLAPPASAAVFQFVPIEFENATLPGDLPNDPALSPIQVALELEESAGKIYFVILNTSDQGNPAVDGSRPAVTAIYIEDPADLLGGGQAGTFDVAGSFGTVAGDGVSYVDSASGGTLQGKNNVSPSFATDFHFSPNPTPAQNGIDPGERGSFEVGTASKAAVEAALVSGEIRVGLHIQQIGEDGEDSAGYLLTVVPEPSTLLLGLCSSVLLLVRRRA